MRTPPSVLEVTSWAAPADSLRVIRVLVLCTANSCRSPIAAALLRRHLAERGIEGVVVESAGFLPGGYTVPALGLARAHHEGIDLSGHRSRRVDAAALRGADLVLAMETRHVRDATELAPDALPAIFTVPELVRRTKARGPRRGETPTDYVHELSSRRSRADVLGERCADVTDPVGGPPSGYDRMWETLDRLTAEVVEALWPRSARSQAS